MWTISVLSVHCTVLKPNKDIKQKVQLKFYDKQKGKRTYEFLEWRRNRKQRFENFIRREDERNKFCDVVNNLYCMYLEQIGALPQNISAAYQKNVCCISKYWCCISKILVLHFKILVLHLKILVLHLKNISVASQKY